MSWVARLILRTVLTTELPPAAYQAPRFMRKHNTTIDSYCISPITYIYDFSNFGLQFSSCVCWQYERMYSYNGRLALAILAAQDQKLSKLVF